MNGDNDSVTYVPRRARSEEGRHQPALILVGNVDRPGPPSQLRIIDFEQTLLIGRHDPEGEDRDHPAWVVKDRMVSGRHARITKGDEGWELEDLGSSNGTVVDGLLAQPKVLLREGAMLFVGGQVAIFRVLSQADLAAITAELETPLGPVPTCNPEFALRCNMLRKLAENEGEVLLTGETGVGKEVYANAIHKASKRAGKFVAINCAALPRELVESELFGYMRGAHSQAVMSKPGLVEEAEGGTLFLDEVGDMPPELQTKLLRFTQDRMLMPVGATKPRRVDVRILAATSRTLPPSGSGGGGGLRQDLAARLGAEPVRIPPLRDRREDLGALIAHILGSRVRPLEPLALQAICLYGWPGNIRELEKVLSTAEALSRDDGKIGVAHLPQAIAATPGRIRSTPPGKASRPPPTAVEMDDLLRKFHGNVLRVARELDRKPPLVYRWVKRYNLDLDVYRKRDEP
jgi:DNA-binding NtrC family response regulator